MKVAVLAVLVSLFVAGASAVETTKATNAQPEKKKAVTAVTVSKPAAVIMPSYSNDQMIQQCDGYAKQSVADVSSIKITEKPAVETKNGVSEVKMAMTAKDHAKEEQRYTVACTFDPNKGMTKARVIQLN